MFNSIQKLFKKEEVRGMVAYGTVNQGAPSTSANAWPVSIAGSTSSSQTDQRSRSVSTGQVHDPIANTAAIITLGAAGVGISNVISGIAWSYNADPTGGNLIVENGSGSTVFSIDITNQGPGFIPFNPPKKGTANTDMIITLAAGGASVVGKVNLLNSWTE